MPSIKGTAAQNIFPYKVVQRVVKISETTIIYKNIKKKREENKFRGYFLGPETMSP